MSNLMNLSQEKLAALRSEYKRRNVRGKYPRQKMLPEYQSLYPWVLPDEADPYFAFCSICECRLSAKRSDLGKHEGSIKHTENASKKSRCFNDRVPNASGEGLVVKGSHMQTSIKLEEGDGQLDESNSLQQQFKLESNDSITEITVSDDDDDRDFNQRKDEILIKQEPIVHLEESNNVLNLDEQNQCIRDDSQESPLSVSGEAAYDAEAEDDEIYIPLPAKRRVSETDYIHRYANKLHMTVGDRTSVVRRFSVFDIPEPTSVAPYLASSCQTDSTTATQCRPTHRAPSFTTPQAPCKITIKKITAPIITPPLHPALPMPTQTSATSISISKRSLNQPATTTSIGTDAMTTSCRDVGINVLPSLATASMTVTAARDSFDLFFDSICASVKALPPKLATEGKIRVMQLIGELELRAITEREQWHAMTTGQQNSTVASTTK